ncbi:MAG: hypothetical protein GYA21_00450 [Myxococcales bacterium]|nr:hypothetical protein [Myxococcales bacterium]
MLVAAVISLLLQAPSPGWPIAAYPGAELFPMGTDAAVNGRPLSLYYFSIEEDLDTVLAFYREAWTREGHVVSVVRVGETGAAIGYLDLASMAAVNLVLVQEGKTLFGFPAVMANADQPAALVTSSGDLPVPSEAEGVTRYESHERGGRFRTLSCAVRQPPAAVEVFYLREMGRRGFDLSSRRAQAKEFEGVMLEFARGPKTINVTISSPDGGASSAVFLVANFQAPQPAEGSP